MRRCIRCNPFRLDFQDSCSPERVLDRPRLRHLHRFRQRFLRLQRPHGGIEHCLQVLGQHQPAPAGLPGRRRVAAWGMKQIEFYRWWIDGKPKGQDRTLTPYHMTRETALARYPGAEPDLSSLEVRTVPENTIEHLHASTPARGVPPGE